MARALPIRDAIPPPDLRALARRDRDGRVGARLLAIANAFDGMSRRQAALKALILKGPHPERDGLSAWRLRDLCDLVAARCGKRWSETGLLRLVQSLNLSWQKARPIHPGAASDAEQERLNKLCPVASRR